MASLIQELDQSFWMMWAAEEMRLILRIALTEDLVTTTVVTGKTQE